MRQATKRKYPVTATSIGVTSNLKTYSNPAIDSCTAFTSNVAGHILWSPYGLEKRTKPGDFVFRRPKIAVFIFELMRFQRNPGDTDRVDQTASAPFCVHCCRYGTRIPKQSYDMWISIRIYTVVDKWTNNVKGEAQHNLGDTGKDTDLLTVQIKRWRSATHIWLTYRNGYRWEIIIITIIIIIKGDEPII